MALPTLPQAGFPGLALHAARVAPLTEQLHGLLQTLDDPAAPGVQQGARAPLQTAPELCTLLGGLCSLGVGGSIVLDESAAQAVEKVRVSQQPRSADARGGQAASNGGGGRRQRSTPHAPTASDRVCAPTQHFADARLILALAGERPQGLHHVLPPAALLG